MLIVNYLENFFIGAQRKNLSMFWDIIWSRNISSIIMLYELTENVSCRK